MYYLNKLLYFVRAEGGALPSTAPKYAPGDGGREGTEREKERQVRK